MRLNVAAAAAVAAARRGAEASDHVETNTSGGEFETFTWSGAKASASSLAAELAAPRPLALDRVYPVALEHSRTLILAIAIMLAAVFRLAGLSARGLAADETNKLRAIDAYHRLDFTANAEHPMLMKLTMLASTDVARGWNRLAAAAHLPVIAAEAALRFPNALAGAFTTVLIFWLVELMFDWPTAAFASLLWALDVNATAINRLGKEDTLLVFFLFLAMWCYERAKRVRTADPAAAARWHLRSGAAFGLSVAAKYMPHYLGMYFVFNAADDTYSAGTGPRFRKFFSAFGVAFLVANFALLIPSTWRYVLHYVEGDMLEHTGYQFAHHLYVNAMAASPWGVPPTFYFVYLATKVPVVVLLAMALGVIPLVRRRRERGFVFLRVFLVLFLLPYSLLASKFVRYMLPLFAVLDILAATGIVWAVQQLQRLRVPERTRTLAAGAAALLLLGSALAAQLSATPISSLYHNAIGARVSGGGYLFPDDEFYDLGMREAVQQVASIAAPGAVIVSDATGVVSEYVRRFGRPDLESWSISSRGAPMTRVETWVLVQEGHIYFENEAFIRQLRWRPPWREVQAPGATAVQIYKFPR